MLSGAGRSRRSDAGVPAVELSEVESRATGGWCQWSARLSLPRFTSQVSRERGDVASETLVSAATRRPATINRYLSLLKHMFNWAVREYLDRTPFRRGSQNLIPMELEDNRRHRRLIEEEKALLAHAAGHLRTLIIAALDAGMRRGEMLALTWADVDAKPGWLRLRGQTTKSGRTRWVPVSTGRLKAVLDFQRVAAD